MVDRRTKNPPPLSVATSPRVGHDRVIVFFFQKNKYLFTEASRNLTLGISKNKAAKYLKTNKEHARSKYYKGVKKNINLVTQSL